MEVNKIYHNDWMNNTLEDKSVQLIIADPPYFEVKGEFDFVWKSFDEYLTDVERWAMECKRILADNGTLFWYGNSKKIAYSQIILDRYFNLENSLVWRKKDSIQYQYYSPDLARTFNTHNERLLMYSNDVYNLTQCVYNIRHYIRSEIGRAKGCVILKDINEALGTATNGGGVASACLSLDKAEPAMLTKEMYNKLRLWLNNGKEYEYLRKEYEELRKEYEEQRRFFYNPNKYEEVLEFSQEGHTTGKYDHDTCKPETLTRALILTCSRPNDLVLIPFAGSGTECAMAAKEGRRFIGFDVLKKYVDMGTKRVTGITSQTRLPLTA